ncbi:ATP-binding protein [Clostridium sp.]|uniref:ATP-binding protein n=1 Tax=Clostridium sp. TaxID=1506 RepID=UPI00260A951D|nr:ATP-binding protein [uncultured Clostridium sp.]
MQPTKEFFISYIIRDISLEKAITDLIDNSIEAAKSMSNSAFLNDFKIQLTFKKNKFIIKDNCGGISKDNAKNYAFTFGHINLLEEKTKDANHFGIGMKRSLFKIGNNIKIESATSKGDHFTIALDVNNWMKQPMWDIKLNDIKISINNDIGTIIEIRQLNKVISIHFSDNKFIFKLKEILSKTYKQALEDGIKIVVNDTPLSYSDTDIEVFRDNAKVSDFNVEIVIKKGENNIRNAGWSIYLDEILVVEADKSVLTGWNCSKLREGFSSPIFEEKFYCFRGSVYVRSNNKNTKLPFTTTKSGLDTSTQSYLELRNLIVKIMTKELPIFDNGIVNIRYQKSKEEVEKLKRILKVKYAKSVGEITYDEYIRTNKIKI